MIGALHRGRQAGWGQVLQAGQLLYRGAQWSLSRRILGSCTGLMQAIRVLVLASKDLQREIVESGRVSWDRGRGRGADRGAFPAGGVLAHLLGHAAPTLVLLGLPHQLPGAPFQPQGLILVMVPGVSWQCLISLPTQGTPQPPSSVCRYLPHTC